MSRGFYIFAIVFAFVATVLDLLTAALFIMDERFAMATLYFALAVFCLFCMLTTRDCYKRQFKEGK